MSDTIKKWEIFWVPPNPPTHAAKECQCEIHSCHHFIWGDSVAVKSMLGTISLYCTVRLGIATRDELEEAFQVILAERKAEKAAQEEIRRKAEPPPKPKKKRKRRKKSDPKPKPPEPKPDPKPAEKPKRKRGGRKKLKPTEPPEADPLQELGLLEVEESVPVEKPKKKRRRKRPKISLPPGLGDLNADARKNAPKPNKE